MCLHVDIVVQGVPLRLELGPRDMKQNQVVIVRRDNGEKLTMKNDNIVQQLSKLLNEVQASMFERLVDSLTLFY